MAIISRDFRGTTVYLERFTLGTSPAFAWTADKSRVVAVNVKQARTIIAAALPYTGSDSVAAINKKGIVVFAKPIRTRASIVAAPLPQFIGLRDFNERIQS
jgi:hypothetical protein